MMRNLSKKIVYGLLFTNLFFDGQGFCSDPFESPNRNGRRPLLTPEGTPKKKSSAKTTTGGAVLSAPSLDPTADSLQSVDIHSSSGKIDTSSKGQIEDKVDEVIEQRNQKQTLSTQVIETKVDELSESRKSKQKGGYVSVSSVSYSSVPFYTVDKNDKKNPVIKTSFNTMISYADWLNGLAPQALNDLGGPEGLLQTNIRHTRKYLDGFILCLLVPNFDVVFNPSTGKIRKKSDIRKLAEERDLDGDAVELIKSDVEHVIKKNSTPGIKCRDVEATRQPGHLRNTSLPIGNHDFKKYVEMAIAAYRIMTWENPDLLDKEFLLTVKHKTNDEPARKEITYDGKSYFYGFDALGINDPQVIEAGVYAAKYMLHKMSVSALQETQAQQYQSAIDLIGLDAVRQYAVPGEHPLRPLTAAQLKNSLVILAPHVILANDLLGNVEKVFTETGKQRFREREESRKALLPRLYDSIPEVLEALLPYKSAITASQGRHALAKYMFSYFKESDRWDGPKYSGSYLDASTQAKLTPVTNFGISDADRCIAILNDLHQTLLAVSTTQDSQ
jgi:hypothetical protein